MGFYQMMAFQLLISSPYWAKWAMMFLKIFFMEKSPFFSIEVRSPTPGHLK
jgi:hypothetical protein